MFSVLVFAAGVWLGYLLRDPLRSIHQEYKILEGAYRQCGNLIQNQRRGEPSCYEEPGVWPS